MPLTVFLVWTAISDLHRRLNTLYLCFQAASNWFFGLDEYSSDCLYSDEPYPTAYFGAEVTREAPISPPKAHLSIPTASLAIASMSNEDLLQDQRTFSSTSSKSLAFHWDLYLKRVLREILNNLHTYKHISSPTVYMCLDLESPFFALG